MKSVSGRKGFFDLAETPAALAGPEDPGRLGRVAVIAETVILIVAVSLAARALAEYMGWPTREARNALLFGPGGPDWTRAAGYEALWLILRYGLTLLLAYGVSRWVGGPSRRMAGLSLGGRSLASLCGLGFVLGLILNAPVQTIDLAKRAFGFGQNTPMWDKMQTNPWTPGFWLFMAVSSFVLVPIVEELLFRSYVLGRYRMHFTPGAAVLVCTALFWVSHGQYLKADAFLLAHSVLTFAGAGVMAWTVVRTGSIVPALVAHVVINVPLPPPLMAVSGLAGLGLIVVFRRPIGQGLSDLGRTLSTTREWAFLAGTAVVLLGGSMLIRTQRAAIGLVLALCVAAALAGLIRRAPWTRQGRR